MTQLSVNVNKIATLRNARGQNVPNLLTVSQDIVLFGAFGLTVHPRPDERHITYEDVHVLSSWLREHNANLPAEEAVEFNVEGYPSPEFMNLIQEVKPHQCTLVPDPPEVLTSNAGWRVTEKYDLLQEVLNELKTHKVRSSLFIDPHCMNPLELKSLEKLGPDRVELYTESFAKDFLTEQRDTTTEIYRKIAVQIFEKGIHINAGHDLDLQNLRFLVKRLPMIKEVSIGHALICESLYHGLETTLKAYLKILQS